MGEKLLFRWSRDQCSAKQGLRCHLLVGLGFVLGLGFGGLGSEFGFDIRVQGQQK